MIPELQQLGFTRNEANVYLASLKIGPASVGQLAQETGLNRITVHSIIEKFEKMSLMLRTYAGKRRKLTAVSPVRLKALLEQEERSVWNKKTALEEILPNLQDYYAKQSRGTETKIFHGVEGYKQMCEDVLDEQKPMLEFADIALLEKALGSYLHSDFLPRKHKLGIPTDFLLVDSPQARRYIEKNYMKSEASPMRAKFIDQKKFPLDALFVLYGDKVSILSPKTLDGIIVRDASICETLKPFFHFVWESSSEEVSNYEK